MKLEIHKHHLIPFDFHSSSVEIRSWKLPSKTIPSHNNNNNTKWIIHVDHESNNHTQWVHVMKLLTNHVTSIRLNSTSYLSHFPLWIISIEFFFFLYTIIITIFDSLVILEFDRTCVCTSLHLFQSYYTFY